MATYYVINTITVGYDKVLLGNLVPEIKKTVEEAVEHAKKQIEETGFDGVIYNTAQNIIHNYEDGEWDENEVEITDDILEEAEDYVSLYIEEAEYDI